MPVCVTDIHKKSMDDGDLAVTGPPEIESSQIPTRTTTDGNSTSGQDCQEVKSGAIRKGSANSTAKQEKGHQEVHFGATTIHVNSNQRSEPDNRLQVMRENFGQSIRHSVEFSVRRFDVAQLPADILRIYHHLKRDFGEEYALLFVFSERTAVELHRAWHMSLLTSKIMQEIKDKFKLRMTWNLGVLNIIFRVEDGMYELHRKVPYDYDSEYQDLYTKIAIALIEGHINVHEALIFQTETKKGKHTAESGMWLMREFPGRLLLYPLVAATCTVIFFGGDWADAGIAAVCGLAGGLVEYGMGFLDAGAKVLLDLIVGGVTGVIASLFFRHQGESFCLSSIFFGTLYWFFYGTAFVIGVLEILAGELETGVTRFIAVSIKTFVLSLGASLGMLLILEAPRDVWVEQASNCGRIDLSEKWWRIPLYLLCSAGVLGQYRFPLVNYWRGLVVQLVAYEVQYQFFEIFARWQAYDQDLIDTATANIMGAVASVVTACALSFLVNQTSYYYNARLLHRYPGKFSKFGEYVYSFTAFYVRASNWLRVGRKSEYKLLQMEKKLKEQNDEVMSPDHLRTRIVLEPEEEILLVEAIVGAENLSVWALLMPAVYQLVPGSVIARLWFDLIFPPPLIESENTIPFINGTNYTFSTFGVDESSTQANVFANLLVISVSLALGLLLGFAAVQIFTMVLMRIFGDCWNISEADDKTADVKMDGKKRLERMRRTQSITADMFTIPEDVPEVDPVVENEKDK